MTTFSIIWFGIVAGLGVTAFAWCIFLTFQITKLEKEIEDFKNNYLKDWYNIQMNIGHCKNEIEIHEDFLQTKFPDMNKTIMQKYSKHSKNK